MKLQLRHPHGKSAVNSSGLLPACQKYPRSDQPVFVAGYEELCRIDLNGRAALEICGGHGELAFRLAQTFPGAKVTGLDLYVPPQPAQEGWLAQCPNLSYELGTAFDLSRFAPNSLDLIWGQAALHHLAHAPLDLAREALRVLKPGGRLVFIFEPLGHNLVVVPIRAIRMSLGEMGDESNLFLSQIEQMAQAFSHCEVQAFNFLGYPLKAFSGRIPLLPPLLQKMDAFLFNMFPGLCRYGANCNIILTK